MRRLGLLLCLSVYLPTVTAAGVSFSVLASNATVLLGDSVTLPCWLSPNTDAEGMEVRWYRDYNSFNNPVLLYNGHQLQTATQMERYQNRTKLAPRDPNSSGLKQGDVSIRIERVELKDAGQYVCHVSSSEGYDRQHMFLRVEEIGAPPVVSLSLTEDDRVNVSCISTGWHPEPQLQWSLEGQRALQPGGLCLSQEPSGLFSVQSWVVRPSTESQWISCSVLLASRKEDLKEARVQMQISSLTAGSSRSSWLIAFIIALLAVIALATALLWIIKKKTAKEPPLGTPEEGTALLEKTPAMAYSENMKKHAVDIAVNADDAPTCLKVVKDGKLFRDKEEGTTTDFERCVVGNKNFSEGQHYWEVRLKMPNTPPKSSWWVGVVTESAMQTIRKQKSMPIAGLWCLCSDRDHGVHILSGSTYYVSVGCTPEILGIFLDHDNGRLSFYDTNLRRHLVTMKCCFAEKVCPLFNPGLGDTAPLEIVCLTKTNENEANEKS
ncbi:hypothetical protein ACEWY4_024867 [Coilia grayii]|uniref:Butyrophilin subfamily 1 member A1-like n=1 Tax=Coilia grayii TaxID=363190 RepID=A0ABD1IVY2_9TELE